MMLNKTWDEVKSTFLFIDAFLEELGFAVVTTQFRDRMWM